MRGWERNERLGRDEKEWEGMIRNGKGWKGIGNE